MALCNLHLPNAVSATMHERPLELFPREIDLTQSEAVSLVIKKVVRADARDSD